MVQALASSVTSTPGKFMALSSGATSTNLQAQLTRYQQQLSECTNCASAKTAAGKANIELIAARIGEVKARIENLAPVLAPSNNAGVASKNVVDQTASVLGSAAAGATLGTLLDVYA